MRTSAGAGLVARIFSTMNSWPGLACWPGMSSRSVPPLTDHSSPRTSSVLRKYSKLRGATTCSGPLNAMTTCVSSLPPSAGFRDSSGTGRSSSK